MEDPNLPHDAVSGSAPFDLDYAVEWLVECCELRSGVHFLFDEDETREPMSVEFSFCALRERVDLRDLVHVRRGRQQLDHGPPRLLSRESGDRPAQGHAEVREVDGRTDNGPAFLGVLDRLLAPRVPVDHPQALLFHRTIDVHAQGPKLRESGVRRLGRDRDQTATACLQAVREEGQSEEELLLARRSLEDHARAHR